MTIHFFTKGSRNAGSSRQRAFIVAEELNKTGVVSIIHEPPLVFVSQEPWYRKLRLIILYLKIFTQIKKDDVIFLQRAIYNKYFFIIIVFYKILFRPSMVFDFDDAIYKHSFLKTKILTKLASVVIVGSHSLAEWAQQYNNNVEIIPTCVKFEDYKKFSKNYSIENDVITIGWVGGAKDQFENLKLLTVPLTRLSSRGLHIKIIIIGTLGFKPVYDLFSSIEGLETEFTDSLNWSDIAAVPNRIQQFDIGVMPLVDSEWNRGKCAFKAIEYMACGVATVCSEVGENKFLIKDGINGFLAKDEEEWYAKLEKLIIDGPLRERLGRNGQKMVEKQYSYKSNIPKLVKIFESI